MPIIKFIAIAAILFGLGLHAAAARDGAAAPADIPGAFDVLAPGEQFIANSLFQAQTGPDSWSRDQIAAAKLSGDGWGDIFREMKRDGLLTDNSLGRVIRTGGRARSASLEATPLRPAGVGGTR
jgi:hypothetical protein